ncbi:MAG: DUF4262 domain-containing protein, partial [Planctomycetes bacterium]|nr:DUF4262 domain-containing protein [Planctomycetota bacterium]
MRRSDDSLTEGERKVLADVAETGVHVVHVEATADTPGHSCSVGLFESFGQPEIVVFGLPGQVAEELIQAVADANDGGTLFLAGSRHEGLLQDYPVRFCAVPDEVRGGLFGVARWAYEDETFPAVQLVWPD